ncbi:MAG: hypothetical protein JWR38_805 [Mucilaginibacter sp.]|nr:hypothetical protein [Mucilaginibacter sp.]
MKRFLLLLIFICTLFACNGQQRGDAKKLAKGIQTLRKENTPGSIATSATGYYMKCKIDGKDWVAVSMLPLKVDNRVLGYNAAGDYIGIPGITQNIQPGYKYTVGKTKGIDLYIENDKSLIDKNGDVILLDKEIGKVEITKRDGEWVEGTFYFTASSSAHDKKKVVTEGVFRVR